MPVDFPALHDTPTDELRDRAKALKIEGADRMRHGDLVFAIGQEESAADEQSYGRGVLEVHGEGFGFLRSPHDNFLPGPDDIYVSQSQIRRFKLQTGDTVIGVVRPPKEGERYTALLRVESVNGEPPGGEPPSFDSLTAIHPDDRLQLGESALLKAVDLAAPIGLGQRGILLAEPGTDPSELLHGLSDALASEGDLAVTVLLIGDRPEDIHEWRTKNHVEVVATPFDEPPARHVQVADIVFERARRMVERGDDAVLLVDSLSRLLRFCVAEVAPSGRTVNGVDTAPLERLRRYLGAARALEEGGSLTVIAAVAADEADTLDAALARDLRDVVNWSLYLSRDLLDRGITPPIDVRRSGTRRPQRLLSDDEKAERAKWRSGLTGELVADAQALVAKAGS